MEGKRETLWQNWRQDSTVQDADVRDFKGQTGISGDLGEGHCQETSAVALEKGARNGVGDYLNPPAGCRVLSTLFLICQSSWQWPRVGKGVRVGL